METNIFRPIQLGKEVFFPKSFDEQSFVMDWTVQAGGKVPPHVHYHMDEHFKITAGEIEFSVNGEKIRRKAGEEFLVPKGITHAVSNIHSGQSGMTVPYSPCADTHRMFQIVSALDEEQPGSMMNMIKYFYLVPRLGIREFSRPQPEWAMAVINAIVTIIGKLSGWDKLVARFAA